MAFDYNELILGDKTDAFLRRLAINLAIIGFLVHLFACVLYRFEYLDLSDTNDFFDSYLDSLYTPFSIILAYEVYELIRAIPESFSNSIGKQFEVISLLVVRDIFKNLAEIDDSNVNAVDSDVIFIAVEALAFTILFATALYFRKMTNSSGDSSRRVGDIVGVKLPTPEPKHDEIKWEDQYLSGKYMISAIKHTITKDNYTMKAELIRDSVSKPYPDVKSQML